MKPVITALALLLLLGCHHQMKPQTESQVAKQAPETAPVEFNADALMADFAHRY